MDIRVDPRPPEKGGDYGEPCTVGTNHFLLEFQDQEFHVYDVKIDPSPPSHLWYMAMEEIKRILTLKGGFAYDKQRLYTTVPLSFSHVKVTPWDVELGVSLTFVGSFGKDTSEAVKMAETVLSPSPDWESFVQRNLGGGLVAKEGFSVSVSLTEIGYSMSLDISAAIYIFACTGVQFVGNVLRQMIVPETKLSEDDVNKAKGAMDGVLVELMHLPSQKCILRGLTEHGATNLEYLSYSYQRIGVVEYFRQTYNLKIKYPLLPCAVVEIEKKNHFIPLEFCKIVEQRFNTQLTEDQTLELENITCKGPMKREGVVFWKACAAIEEGRSLKEFGLSVVLRRTTVPAFRLTAPTLQPKGTEGGTPEIETCGSCLRNVEQKKFYLGGTLKQWACIQICDDFDINRLNILYDAFRTSFEGFGLDFERPKMYNVSCQGNINKNFERLLNALRRYGLKFAFLFIIIPDESYYGVAKSLCDRRFGVASQFCLEKTIKNMNPEISANLAFNISAKIGVKVIKLGRAIGRLSAATMICGAYMVHSPGDSNNPSCTVAGVVASVDWPDCTSYITSIESYKDGIEIITNLSKVFRTFITQFQSNMGKFPESIILYRGGKNGGNYRFNLRKEVELIHQTCSELNFRARITCIWVDKLHKTRLFPERNYGFHDRNIGPGTLVDSHICHPSDFDFFLCSHDSKKGTSRPGYYNVVVDENHFERKDVYAMTYGLCFKHPGCKNPMSTVVPIHYAMCAAHRGQSYMKLDTTELSLIMHHLCT